MRKIFRQVSITTAVMLAAAGLAPRAEAALVQIGSFESADGLYTYNDGTLTGTTTGNFTFDPAFAMLFGLPMTSYDNASLTVDATCSGDATTVAGFVIQDECDGYLEVYDLDTGDLLVRADFEDAVLSGLTGGNSVTLQGSTGAGASITYSSDVFDDTQVFPPHDFRFGLTPTSVPVSESGQNFANFTAPDIANFSTSVETPEPASLALFGFGLTAVGVLARRRRRQ